MKEQLYRRYDVDEDTPVQFVGVYTTHWRGEWGEPEVMFAEIDSSLANNAPRLLELARQIVLEREVMDNQHMPQDIYKAAVAIIAAIKGEG